MPDLDSLQKKILWMRLCFITEKNPVVNPFLMRLLLWTGIALHGIDVTIAMRRLPCQGKNVFASRERC